MCVYVCVCTYFSLSLSFSVSACVYVFVGLTVYRLNINRIGEDLEHLMVSRDPYKDFLIKHDLNHVNRRAAGTQEFNARLSDDYLVGRRRKVCGLLSLFMSLFCFLSECVTHLGQ